VGVEDGDVRDKHFKSIDDCHNTEGSQESDEESVTAEAALVTFQLCLKEF